MLTTYSATLAPRLPTVVTSYDSSDIYLGQALGVAIGGLLLAHTATFNTLRPVGTGLGVGALATNPARTAHPDHGCQHRANSLISMTDWGRFRTGDR